MAWKCENCGKQWGHPVAKCIFCNGDVRIIEPASLVVKGVTEILVPSDEHPKVPYFNLLLEDEAGNYHIRKSFKAYEIGEQLISEHDKSDNNVIVGVLGTGALGIGIAEIFLLAGHHVILRSRSQESLDKTQNKLAKKLGKTCTSDEVDQILGEIEFTTELSDMIHADIIIEAIIEDMDAKKKLFKELDHVCANDTIFATNTSSLSINELSSEISDSTRFIGMHFFNPVSKMFLVEVVRGNKTSDETVEFAKDLAERLGKTPIIVNDSPGFIVNRILMPLLNEAIYELYEGLADAKDIDNAIMLGLNHPMGPLSLADLIGLDICLNIMESVFKEFNDLKYKPCPLLVEMVKDGNLGAKTEKGFYEYKK